MKFQYFRTLFLLLIVLALLPFNSSYAIENELPKNQLEKQVLQHLSLIHI